MLPFGLLYLLVFAVLKATALDPPQAFRIPATLSNLPLTNLTSPDPIIELDGLPVLNQTTTGLSVIPDAFDLEISQGPLKINGKSTYMNILKALVTLSKQDFLANYAGNTFSFEGYTDMRVVITRTNSRSAALQYRFAIFGLYSGIYHISQKSKFRETFITLYWSGSGSKTTVGYIRFLPWPPPDPLSKVLPQPIDSTNLTLISEDEDTSNSLTAPLLTISPIFGGNTMTLSEVFLTIYSGLVFIAGQVSSQPINPFSTSESHVNGNLKIENSRPPRPWYPFYTYEIAARSLGLLPDFMFQQGKFEDVAYVVKIEGTTVGGGTLTKGQTALSIPADIEII